jgi:WD40 repeat protein
MSKLKSKFPLLASLDGHHGSILCVAFHPSAPILATGCQDNSILLWDIDSDKPVVTLLGHTAAVTCLAFHPSAPLLVSGGGDGKMMMWDTTTHQCLSTTKVYRFSPVSCVAFRPQLSGAEDFDMITGGSSDLLQLWKLSPDNRELTLLEDHGYMGNAGYSSKCIAFHPTQPLVATASKLAGTVFDIHPARRGGKETLSPSVDLETGRARHRKEVLSVAFHPTAPIVVTAGKDKNIMLWELFKAAHRPGRHHEFVELLDDHDGDVTSVAFHPSAPVLFSCSKDRSIKIWHMTPVNRSAFCIDTLTAQSGFTSLMVHPSGRFFATGCEDGTANLWDCSILNIDTQFKMARMRKLEERLISGLILPESMYGMRDPREYLTSRVARRRTRRVILLEDPSAKTATAQENAVRLAELWAKSPKPRSPSPKPRSPSPKPGSPKSRKSRSSSPKPGSPKSPKSDQRGSGGSMTRRRKSRKSRKSRLPY